MAAMSKIEEAAWKLYCEETEGDLDVRDSWEQLPARVQELYINKARMAGCADCEE